MLMIVRMNTGYCLVYIVVRQLQEVCLLIITTKSRFTIHTNKPLLHTPVSDSTVM